MTWDVQRTDPFLTALKQYRKNRAVLGALDKKIERLCVDPESVGGRLSGDLHGWRSTRLVKNYRLIFFIAAARRIVFLDAIDHRKDAY